MSITNEMLDNWFDVHTPVTDHDRRCMLSIRIAVKEFAHVVIVNSPSSADQTVAIRKIREAMQIANASILCNGE